MMTEEMLGMIKRRFIAIVATIILVVVNNTTIVVVTIFTFQDLDMLLKNLKGHMAQVQNGGKKRKNVNYEVK